MRAAVSLCLVFAAAISCRSAGCSCDDGERAFAASPDERLPAPWPGSVTSDALQAFSVARGYHRAARVSTPRDDAVAFFEKRLQSCGATRSAAGRDGVRVACDSADGESSALVVTAAGGAAVLTRWQRPSGWGGQSTSMAPLGCGPGLRWLGPPADAHARFVGALASTGSEGELAHCAFLTALDADAVLKQMVARVFSGAASVTSRGNRGLLVVEGWDRGVYWRIDAARTRPRGSAVTVVRWDPAGALPRTVRGHGARVEHLAACSQPCAGPAAREGRALLDTDDRVGLQRWSGHSERCEFACDGEPGAPPGIVADEASVWERDDPVSHP